MNKNKKYYKKSRISNRTLLISCLLFLLLLASVLFFVYYRGQNTLYSDDEISQSADSLDQVNYDPPSEEIKEETEDYKKSLSNEDGQDNLSTDIHAVIVYAGVVDDRIEVSSFIAGVSEDGGNCIFKFSKGSESIEKQVEGVQDVSKTVCPTLELPKSEFSKGTWTINVSYVSENVSTNQTMKTFEVE